MGPAELRLDQIGYWSEIKFDIIKDYATTYTTILSKQDYIKRFVYIDAFAGAGVHISKNRGEFIPGSPLNSLLIHPPFHHHYFIDLEASRTASLREVTSGFENITIYEGDCNRILTEQIFPQVRYDDYRRALCVLDPYGLHLAWDVIKKAGKMRSIEIFLNFPLMDMNRNVLWHDPASIEPTQAERMTKFWGDESWRGIAYRKKPDLFGENHLAKVDYRQIAKAFQERLQKVAGFEYVLDPLPMKNTRNAVIYYLFFASQKPVASKIVKSIFDKYANR